MTVMQIIVLAARDSSTIARAREPFCRCGYGTDFTRFLRATDFASSAGARLVICPISAMPTGSSHENADCEILRRVVFIWLESAENKLIG